MIKIFFPNEEKEFRYHKDTCTYLLTHRYKDSDFCITECYVEQEIIDILNSRLQDQTKQSVVVYPKQNISKKNDSTENKRENIIKKERNCDCNCCQELKEKLDRIEKLLSQLQGVMMNQFSDENYYKNCIKDWYEWKFLR